MPTAPGWRHLYPSSRTGGVVLTGTRRPCMPELGVRFPSPPPRAPCRSCVERSPRVTPMRSAIRAATRSNGDHVDDTFGVAAAEDMRQSPTEGATGIRRPEGAARRQRSFTASRERGPGRRGRTGAGVGPRRLGPARCLVGRARRASRLPPFLGSRGPGVQIGARAAAVKPSRAGFDQASRKTSPSATTTASPPTRTRSPSISAASREARPISTPWLTVSR
jgi:hypothetical protein